MLLRSIGFTKAKQILRTTSHCVSVRDAVATSLPAHVSLNRPIQTAHTFPASLINESAPHVQAPTSSHVSALHVQTQLGVEEWRKNLTGLDEQ